MPCSLGTGRDLAASLAIGASKRTSSSSWTTAPTALGATFSLTAANSGPGERPLGRLPAQHREPRPSGAGPCEYEGLRYRGRRRERHLRGQRPSRRAIAPALRERTARNPRPGPGLTRGIHSDRGELHAGRPVDRVVVAGSRTAGNRRHLPVAGLPVSGRERRRHVGHHGRSAVLDLRATGAVHLGRLDRGTHWSCSTPGASSSSTGLRPSSTTRRGRAKTSRPPTWSCRSSNHSSRQPAHPRRRYDVAFEGITFAYATWLGPSTTDGYVAVQASITTRGSPAALREAARQRDHARHTRRRLHLLHLRASGWSGARVRSRGGGQHRELDAPPSTTPSRPAQS